MSTRVLLTCFLLGLVVDGKLSDHIKPCDAQDPALSICLLESAQKIISRLPVGIPDIGIPPSDPFTIPELSLVEPYTGMNLTLLNTVVRGMSGMRFTEASAQPENFRMRFVIVLPIQTYVSNYILRGRFMFMPIFDTGKSNATFYNTKVSWDITGKPEVRDGVTYMRLTDLDVTAEPAYLNVELSNPFNGNQLLTNILNRLMKTHWREVYHFIKPELEGLYARALFEIMDHLLGITPYDQVFENVQPE